MAALLQIVGSVGSTTSLLDLNDDPTGILAQRSGLDLQQPGAGSGADRMPLWSQPDAVTEATTRRVTLAVVLFSTTVDGLGTKAQTLMRLVSKAWVLRVRRSGASADSWLRCYPCIPTMSSEITGTHRGTTLAGVITCDTEPYAYGARVDAGPTTVTQNPNTSTAFTLDVTGVTGDAPTPAVIRCTDTTLLGGAHATLVAVRRTGTPTALSGLYTSADAGTATVVGSGVTATDPFSDGTFSGGTGVRLAFTSGYAGGSSYGRVVWTPSLTGAEAPGLYKLLARVRRSASEDITLQVTVAGQFVLDPLVWPAGGTNTRVLDLGLVQLPAGQPQQLAAPVAAAIGAASPQLDMHVLKGATSTANNIDVDWFYLVPADEDLGVAYQSGSVPSGTYLTLDGYAQEAYLSTGDPFVGTSAGYSGSTSADWVGGVPRLYPGSNRLFLVAGLNAAGAAPANTLAPGFSVSYWPRYTWLI